MLAWLLGEKNEHLETVSIPIEGEEAEVQVLEVAALVNSRHANSFIDRIRFAASNRLLVRLGYNGSKRDIEPYSLARSSEGHLLLRAIRHQDGQPRSYRFDRIENVQVLEQSFTPRFAIEITSAGRLPVHQLTR